MKQFGFKTLLLAVLLAFVFVACDETTTPNDPVKPKPNAPSNMRATSKSDTEIILKWDASTSDTATKFTGYILEITPGTFLPVNLSKSVTTYTVSGLTEGTVYTFKVYSVMDSVESTTAASVSWSPATRFTINVNDAPIRVYETASSLGSGLDLYDPVGRKPKTLTVASGSEWNLALDTRTDGVTIIGSPTMVSYSYGTQPRVTQMSTNHYWEDATSLDEVFDSEALSSGPFTETSVDLETLTTNIGVVIVLRTIEPGNTEYTYAKVLIMKTGGTWLQGSVGNRFIECVISYQMTPGVPYAL